MDRPTIANLFLLFFVASSPLNPSMSADEMYYNTASFKEMYENKSLPLPELVKILLEKAKGTKWHYFWAWDSLRRGLPEKTLIQRLENALSTSAKNKPAND